MREGGGAAPPQLVVLCKYFLAIGFVLGAAPGFTHVMPLPFAALVAVPWLGDCGCQLNPCEWNEDLLPKPIFVTILSPMPSHPPLKFMHAATFPLSHSSTPHPCMRSIGCAHTRHQVPARISFSGCPSPGRSVCLSLASTSRTRNAGWTSAAKKTFNPSTKDGQVMRAFLAR